MKSSFKKILSVFTSLVIFLGINEVKASNSFVSIICQDGNEMHVSHQDFGIKSFSREDLQENGYYIPQILNANFLPQAIPSDTTIGQLVDLSLIAINDLVLLKNSNNLNNTYKRRLMKTINNVLQTFLHPVANLQNAMYSDDDPEYASSDYNTIILADSINSETFNNFDNTIGSLRHELNDNRIQNFYGITIEQTEANNFRNQIRDFMQN